MLVLLFSGKAMFRDVNYEFIQYRKKDKKKPAAFYFRRSATPTLPSFASLRFAKLAAVPRRVMVRPYIRLQTREKCLLPEIYIQLKEKAGSFLLSR